MVAPRLHLQMLLSGQHDIDYLCSVVGVLNLANVLAVQLKREDLVEPLDAAQHVVSALINEGRALRDDEAAILQEGFNLADAWICIQNTLALQRALDYEARELKKQSE